jgi:hypothetical protein
MCTAVQLVGRAVTSTTDSRAAGCAAGGTCPARKTEEPQRNAARNVKAVTQHRGARHPRDAANPGCESSAKIKLKIKNTDFQN